MYPGQMFPLANQTYWYRALLHQVSLPYGRMQIYPGQIGRCTPALIKPSVTEHVHRADVPHPQLIKPTGTEHYYP